VVQGRAWSGTTAGPAGTGGVSAGSGWWSSAFTKMAGGVVHVAEGAAGQGVALDVLHAGLHLPRVFRRAREAERDQNAVALGILALAALHVRMVEDGAHDRGTSGRTPWRSARGKR
jgi:hypothetical protein